MYPVHPQLPCLPAGLRRCASVLAFTSAMLSTSAIAAPHGVSGDYTLFINANIVNMEQDGSTPRRGELLVKDGDILAMRSRGTAAWMARRGIKGFKTIDLQGDILMPGFVEPHAHLANMTQMGQVADVSPCWPDKFEKRARYDRNAADNSAACPLYINDAVSMVYAENNLKSKKGNWIVGNGIDPSRMTTVAGGSVQDTAGFVDKPAAYFAKNFSQEKPSPVFLLDQSGHVAYVNQQAMQVAFKEHCTGENKCPGLGKTQIEERETYQPMDSSAKYDYACSADDVCNYTGRLLEPSAYTPFLADMQRGLKDGQIMFNEDTCHFIAEGKAYVNAIAKAGVTTFVNGGAFDLEELDHLQGLLDTTWTGKDGATMRAPLRVISLIAWNAGTSAVDKTPLDSAKLIARGMNIWDQRGQRFGVQGVKLWADGSTQGCSAALTKPYNENGICAKAATGHANYQINEIRTNLQPYWNAGWYVNVHANGDQAISDTVDALTLLGSSCRGAKGKASSACGKAHTLLHFTVDGNGAAQDQEVPQAVRKVAELRAKHIDLGASMLIGHVAYWGAAFQTILDGVPKEQQNSASDPHGRASQLDAARSLRDSKVPFSLHSDGPVSPTVPLWLAEQAVTRNTWVYPKLKTSAPSEAIAMPGAQGITLDDALRAITVVPARQHQLFDRIGSLRAGKKADFVRLEKTSYEAARQDPTLISAIKVVGTYLDGAPVEYFPTTP